MDTRSSLEITTIMGCVNMCSYCPQKMLLNTYNGIKKMSFEEFKVLLKNVPTNVDLCFAGFSEAFLNRDSSKMVKWSVEQGYDVTFYTTLFGIVDEDFEILRNTPELHMAYHRYDGVTYNKENFDKNIDKFNEIVLNEPKFSNTYNGKISPHSRAGSLWDVPSLSGPVYCSATRKHDCYDRNVLMPNGDVTICCMDYGLKHKIGNLYDTDFYSLDRSEIIKSANMQNSDLICRKCVMVKNK